VGGRLQSWVGMLPTPIVRGADPRPPFAGSPVLAPPSPLTLWDSPRHGPLAPLPACRCACAAPQVSSQELAAQLSQGLRRKPTVIRFLDRGSPSAAARRRGAQALAALREVAREAERQALARMRRLERSSEASLGRGLRQAGPGGKGRRTEGETQQEGSLKGRGREGRGVRKVGARERGEGAGVVGGREAGESAGAQGPCQGEKDCSGQQQQQEGGQSG